MKGAGKIEITKLNTMPMSKEEIIDRLNHIRSEQTSLIRIKQLIGKPNLRMSWGQGKNEVLLTLDDRVLVEIHKAFTDVVAKATEETEEELTKYLKEQ